MTTNGETSDTIIRFEEVHKSFGSQHILRGLNFEVKRGTTVGLMGGSGTGKSVTLRHVIGLLTQDSGRVEVEGFEMSSIKPKDLRELRLKMGYVFQSGALINWLTIAENLALPLEENSDLDREEIDRRVQEKLEMVYVPEAGPKYPSEISGGMKKRVALARALITDPQIILYDEPNAGLDPQISASINKLIRELSDKLGMTGLLVEHRIPCLKTVADEVIFMYEGKALVREPVASFFKPTHPLLVDFLGEDAD